MHTAKMLGMSGHMSRYRDALSIVVAQRFKLLRHGACSASAAAFKTSVLESLSSGVASPKRQGILAAVVKFFNANWQGRVVGHICSGEQCCSCEVASMAKAIYLSKKLFSTFRPKIFPKANSTGWPHSSPFFTLASALHGVDAFELAFSSRSTDTEDALRATLNEISRKKPLDDNLLPAEAGGDELMALPVAKAVEWATDMLEGDAVTQERLQNAISARCALSFMTPSLFQASYLLQLTLLPQQQLMRSLVRQTSGAWEREQLLTVVDLGTRQYRFALLNGGEMLPQFFRETWRLLTFEQHLLPLTSTEELRGQLLKLFLRPAALVHQLVRVRAQIFPYCLFRLLVLDAEDKMRCAEQILLLPKRLRDSWSRSFLSSYSRPDLLCSTEAQCILTVIGKHAVHCTVSTLKESPQEQGEDDAQSRSVALGMSTHGLRSCTLGAQTPKFRSWP